MLFVKVINTIYPAKISKLSFDREWDGRESRSIRLEMTHAEAVKNFTPGVKWSVLEQPPAYENEAGEMVTPEPTVFDNSEYSIPGIIIDHRDGTVTVKMGKPTQAELLQQELAQKNAELDALKAQIADTESSEAANATE